MTDIFSYFQTYGLILTVIAVVGIIILGVLKYCNIFGKIDEKARHFLYLGISVGFSLTASAIYLIIVKQFDITYMAAVATAILALNQMFYNIFKVTTLNDLCAKILDWILATIKKKEE